MKRSVKILPNPIDAKYSYDRYLLAEHGNPRGYFGNAIREIPDDEFSIFESDINRSLSEQRSKVKGEFNEQNVVNANNNPSQVSSMTLEEAIRLTKEQLQKEPERIQDEQNVTAKYSVLFNPHNIDQITSEVFRSFLLYKNNKHWNGLQRQGSKAAGDIEKLRSALREVLDEARPINERLDSVLPGGKYHVEGLGPALLTPILLVNHPKKYAIYNGTTEQAMKYFNLIPSFTNSESFGSRYLHINSIIKDIATKNNLSLWQMDYVWWNVVTHISSTKLDYDNIDSGGQIARQDFKQSIYLTGYDSVNLEISKRANMLAWRDRPSQLSAGDYVFVYNIDTDQD